MDFKLVCDSIFRLYLYADVCKMIHYSTDSNHAHELSDDLRNTIIDLSDELAEGFFGFYGKPRFSELTVKLDINSTDDLGKLCQNVIDVVEPLRKEFAKNNKLSGLVSLIDDFKQKLSKDTFLATFDKVSNYKLSK